MTKKLHGLRSLAAAAAILLGGSVGLGGLGGCAQIEPQREAAAEKPLPAGEVVALLYYAQSVRAMSGKDLTDELERLRQAHTADKGDISALQYALALSVPNASVANQRRALQLLEPFATTPPAEGRSSEVQALATLVRSDLLERRRIEDIAYSQTQKLREEQRRADELDKKVDALTKKLEALVNIERNLLHRDKGTGGHK